MVKNFLFIRAREIEITLIINSPIISFNVREKKTIENTTNTTLIANWTSIPITEPFLLQVQQVQQSLNVDINSTSEIITIMGAMIKNMKRAL